MLCKYQVKKILYLALVAVVLLFNHRQVFAVGFDQAIASALTKALEQYKVPGASLSIAYPDGTVITYVAGYSDLGAKKLMQADQLFLVGSITKSYISALILRLAAKQTFSLDDNLESIAKKYTHDKGSLQKLVLRYPALKPITLRQLLQHNSGLRDAINNPAYAAAHAKEPQKVWSDSELIAFAMREKPFFKPGTPNFYSYTNTDYILAGMVIETVTGTRIKSQLAAIFKDNQLTHTYYMGDGIISPALKPKIAHGYLPLALTQQATQPQKIVALPYNPAVKFVDVTDSYNLSGPSAGGMIATSADVACWYAALFLKQTILPDSMLPLMLQGIRTAHPNTISGLGVMVSHEKVLGEVIEHTGVLPGYTTDAMYLEKYRIAIVLAINSYNQAGVRYDAQTGQPTASMFDTLLPMIIHNIK